MAEHFFWELTSISCSLSR